jgi:hypothetical protein
VYDERPYWTVALTDIVCHSMQCPVCQTENEATRTTCVQCQTALARSSATPTAKRRSRRGAEKQSAVAKSPQATAYNRDVQRVYRLCLVGVIPFVGLILGPLAALIAARIRRRSMGDPAFTLHAPIRFVFILGLLTGITNWVGLALMIFGWMS